MRSGLLVVDGTSPRFGPPPQLVLFPASGGYPDFVAKQGSVIRCAECGAESDELAAGWRAYLAGDLDADEDEVLLFCPECAPREFDPARAQG